MFCFAALEGQSSVVIQRKEAGPCIRNNAIIFVIMHLAERWFGQWRPSISGSDSSGLCPLDLCERYDIYMLIAIGLPLGGSSTVHIYTQTVHRTTPLTTEQHN